MPANPAFDEIRQIYIRMTELSERLLEHPRFHGSPLTRFWRVKPDSGHG
jgi:hypothetical protein